MLNLSKYRIQVFLIMAVLILLGTFAAIKFAQGYRFDFTKKTLVPNGILVANSQPPAANVLVNGRLKTATNNDLPLPPGEYEVEMIKEEFFPWKKKLVIQKELVTFVDAFLFPKFPDLRPLTFHEAINPKISPDNSRIVYLVPLPNTDAGLWVLDLNESLFIPSRYPRLIAKNSLNFDISKSEYGWTPDSRQILSEFPSGAKYLLDPNQLNNISALANVALTLTKMQEKWQEEEIIGQNIKLKKLPEKMLEILEKNSARITFSPDNTKVLYLATASAEIPPNLIPPVVSASTQKENRQIEPNKLYVYDIKEDRNFEITNFQLPIKPTPTPKNRGLKSAKTTTDSQFAIGKFDNLLIPQWFPTSRHLVWINPSAGSGQTKIVACEYDGTNLTTIYSGSFVNPNVFITPSSSKLVILAEIDFSMEKAVTPTLALKSKITPTSVPERSKTNLFSISFR